VFIFLNICLFFFRTYIFAFCSKKCPPQTYDIQTVATVTSKLLCNIGGARNNSPNMMMKRALSHHVWANELHTSATCIVLPSAHIPSSPSDYLGIFVIYDTTDQLTVANDTHCLVAQYCMLSHIAYMISPLISRLRFVFESRSSTLSSRPRLSL
jgi:hypothetical protein